MELPRMLHKDGARLVVSSQVELDDALAAGWQLRSGVPVPPVAVSAPEPEAAPAPTIRRGPGRPRKSQE